MKPITILICGNYGATNLGDEAILSGLINGLNSMNLKVPIKIKALSYNPQQTLTLHPKLQAVNYFLPFGLRSFFRGFLKGELWQTLKAIKSCDFFILGGGGLFSNESWRAVMIWSLHALTAYHYKRPVLMVGQTVEKINNRCLRWLTKKIFSKASLIITRDQESAHILIAQGITNLHSTADCAWSSDLKAIAISNKLAKKPKIGVSLRSYKDFPNSKFQTIKTAINNVFPEAEIIGIPMQSHQASDQQILQNLEISVAKPKSSLEVAQLISKQDFIITMRLHAAIFAAINQKPFLSINYHPKVRSFAKQMQLEQLCLDSTTIDQASLTRILESLKNNFSDYQRKLSAAATAQQQQSQATFKLIQSFLLGHSK